MGRGTTPAISLAQSSLIKLGQFSVPIESERGSGSLSSRMRSLTRNRTKVRLL
jgi:hypothetical protein